jgi:hypothetical protein
LSAVWSKIATGALHAIMRRRDEAWSLACAIHTTRIRWSFMSRRRARPRPMHSRAICLLCVPQTSSA